VLEAKDCTYLKHVSRGKQELPPPGEYKAVAYLPRTALTIS